MTRLLRLMLFIILPVVMMSRACAASDETLLGKFKNFITGTPTPAPAPKKKKKTTPTAAPKKRSPSPTATPRPKRSPSPRPSPTETPTATPRARETPEESPSPSATGEESSPSPSPSETMSPAEEASPAPQSTPEETPSPSPKPGRTTPSISPAPSASKGGTAPVSIAPSEIAGYEKNPPAIRKILDISIDLTTKNLGYKYGSADPSSGGMDCSGFINYVLKQAGLKDVPRDAREQYIWVRKAGKFQAVLGRSADTFELDALKPGDLLFWSGTYKVDRDPAITHTMIYLGREKATNQRVMIGASDGRTYKGQSRYGVSVFDFKIAGRKIIAGNEPGPTFVGYASIPGLGAGEHNDRKSEENSEE